MREALLTDYFHIPTTKGLRRSMTIRSIGMDDRLGSAGMMTMEPDTPLPAPSPYAGKICYFCQLCI